MEYLKGSQDSVNYELILLDLRKRSEMAYKRFLESGGVNVLEYTKDLSESILNALDLGLCYPAFDILQFLKEDGLIGKEKQ